jgi:hypothetical protein
MPIEALTNISPETLWFWGRSAVLVAAFLLFAWALLRERRAIRVMRHELVHEIAESRRQLADLADRLAAMGTAVATLAVSFDVDRPHPASQIPKAAPVRSGYEIAIRLARSGASVDELMASSGATRAEAELLRRLHGGDAVTREADHNPRANSVASHAQS